MTQPFIRYLAATDASPLGLLALEYLKAFLKLRLQVRVGSMTGPTVGAWDLYSGCLTTPMVGAFVNVVCCEPARWIWTQRVPMQSRKPDGTLLFDGDVAEGLQELRTAGVRNVLIIDDNHIALSKAQAGAALKYDAIIIPNEEWSYDGGDAPVTIPVPVKPEHLRLLHRTVMP